MSTRDGPTYRHLARRALAPATPLLPAARRWRWRMARESFIVRLKTLALTVGSTVDVEIDTDLELDGRLSLEIYPGTWNRLRWGPGVRIGDGVRLSLRGGSFDIGAHSELRRLGAYQVTGRLEIGSGVVLSNGVVVHCAESIRIDDLTIIGEYTTITDSAHLRTPPGVAVHHASIASPIVIGSNVWVGAHAVITRGVTVGDQAFVGAAAVVMKDVPAGWLVAGVPARPIRELPTES